MGKISYRKKEALKRVGTQKEADFIQGWSADYDE